MVIRLFICVIGDFVSSVRVIVVIIICLILIRVFLILFVISVGGGLGVRSVSMFIFCEGVFFFC